MRYTVAISNLKNFNEAGAREIAWVGLYGKKQCYEFDCNPEIMSFLSLKLDLIIIKAHDIPMPYPVDR